MEEGGSLTVFLLSDSLGGTAERVYRSAAVQFGRGRRIRVERVAYAGTRQAVEEVVARAAAGRPSLLAYTLVDGGLRAYLERRADTLGVTTVDVLGPMLDALADALAEPPLGVPGLSHRADEEYFRRVEAAEFAVRYDDGKNPRGIRDADLVLVGVSRTSKTPLSLYLANRQLKVANVPIAPEIPVPPELYRYREKAVGLVIAPDLLLAVREERVKNLHLPAFPYASLERIEAELAYAGDLFERLDCPVIDVSRQAVEESAQKVLATWASRRSR